MKCPLTDIDSTKYNSHPIGQPTGYLLQTKACTTLCELSENICAEDQIPTAQLVTQYSFSPWRKNQFSHSKTQPTQPLDKHSNKENLSHQSKLSKKTPATVIVQGKEQRARPAYIAPQHQPQQGITIVTILTRKRSKLNQLQEQRTQLLREAAAMPLQPLKNHPRFKGSKREEKGGKQIQLMGEHWKVRHANSKCKQVRRVSGEGEGRSLELKRGEVGEGKRNSESVDRRAGGRRRLSEAKERQDYCSSNPLTRLLYKKYLSTISLNHVHSNGS